MSAQEPITDDALDAVILKNIVQNWRKCARVICDVADSVGWIPYQSSDFHVAEQRIIQRFYTLFERGLIDAQGDLESPRFSEVRLFEK